MENQSGYDIIGSSNYQKGSDSLGKRLQELCGGEYGAYCKRMGSGKIKRNEVRFLSPTIVIGEDKDAGYTGYSAASGAAVFSQRR